MPTYKGFCTKYLLGFDAYLWLIIHLELTCHKPSHEVWQHSLNFHQFLFYIFGILHYMACTNSSCSRICNARTSHYFSWISYTHSWRISDGCTKNKILWYFAIVIPYVHKAEHINIFSERFVLYKHNEVIAAKSCDHLTIWKISVYCLCIITQNNVALFVI